MTAAETAELAQGILDSHHVLLRRELPRLAEALAGAPPRLRVPFQHLRRVMDEHMAKEENILFPAILALARGEAAGGCGVGGPIAQMMAEHDEIRTLEDALRSASREAGPLEPSLLALLDDLGVHAAKEDALLFPAALELALLAAQPVIEVDEASPPPRRKAVSAPPVGPPAAGRSIRETQGTCSVCLQRVPAAVMVRAGTVVLDKRCPEHGTTSQLLSRRPDRWVELDRYYFSVMDESHPQRDDLEDWVRRVKATGNIAALHTNGIKLTDREYVNRLKAAGVDEVFLQFDGLDEEANKALRGRPLLKARQAALKNLHDAGIATSLIVVIARGLNEAQVSATFRFALEPGNEHIREVFFLGLRNLGSARETGALAGQQLMPDEIIELLTEQEPAIRADDVHKFNLAYFAMLSAFHVKKCLYVQHYLVARDGHGGFTPISDVVDLPELANAAVRYAARRKRHPVLARAGLGASIVKAGLRPGALRMAGDLVRLESLFASGMNLREVPPRFLLIGFIDSGAVVNVLREARFQGEGRKPGPAWRAPARPRS